MESISQSIKKDLDKTMSNPNFKVEDVLGSRARVKILKELAKAEELTISLLIRRTKLNYTNVNRHLNHLISLNLVQEKKFGRIRIFRYRIEDPRARSFSNLIDIWENKIEIEGSREEN